MGWYRNTTIKSIIEALPNYNELSKSEILDIAEYLDSSKRRYLDDVSPTVYKLLFHIPEFYKYDTEIFREILEFISVCRHHWRKREIKKLLKTPGLFNCTAEQLAQIIKEINKKQDTTF
jgi:galactose-1-phosphate uridylyltransferase